MAALIDSECSDLATWGELWMAGNGSFDRLITSKGQVFGELWMAGNGSFDRLSPTYFSNLLRLWMAGNGSFDRLRYLEAAGRSRALDGREWQL